MKVVSIDTADLSCLWAPCISATALWPAACALWAPPANHSHCQRYLWIPADKTIICSASPWFRASGCVWCLPLVSWLEKDGRLKIPRAPLCLLSSLSLASIRTQVCAKSYFIVWQKEHMEKCSNLIPTLLNQNRASRKKHLQDEVIGLVQLKWQSTNTSRSVAHQQKHIWSPNPKRFKA